MCPEWLHGLRYDKGECASNRILTELTNGMAAPGKRWRMNGPNEPSLMIASLSRPPRTGYWTLFTFAELRWANQLDRIPHLHGPLQDSRKPVACMMNRSEFTWETRTRHRSGEHGWKSERAKVRKLRFGANRKDTKKLNRASNEAFINHGAIQWLVSITINPVFTFLSAWSRNKKKRGKENDSVGIDPTLHPRLLLFFLLSSWHSPNSMPSFNKTKEVLRDVEEGEMWNDRPEGQQRTAALWRPNYSFKTIQKEHSFPPLTLRFNFWNSFLKTINLAQIGSDF